MTHLPTSRKERKEWDLERKVQRMHDDRRFQWLRTRKSRLILVVMSALLCIGIIPAFAASGIVLGAVVTAAAFLSYWLLRTSVRTVADLPDRFLDERQRAIRNRSYVDAYRIFTFIAGGLATLALVVFFAVQENDAVTLTTTWDQALGLVMFILVLASVLPSMVVAVREPAELAFPES